MSSLTHTSFDRGRFIRNTILLFVLWFLLSGKIEPLFLGYGVVSCMLTSWLLTRLVYTRDDPLITFRPWALLTYSFWLLGQIIQSSLRVMYLILHPKLPISPGFYKIPATQKSRLGHVTYANSITLTPGTASVDLSDTHILVHSLEKQSVLDLSAGEMDRRVGGCEKTS